MKYLDRVQGSREIFALSIQVIDFPGEPVCCAVVTSWETDRLKSFVFKLVGAVMHPRCSIG